MVVVISGLIGLIAKGLMSARTALVLAAALTAQFLVTSPIFISFIIIVIEVSTGWLSRWVLPWGLELSLSVLAFIFQQTPLLGPYNAMNAALSNPPDTAVWLWYTMRLDLFLSLTLTALGLRFIIRRLPVIG